MIEYAMKHHHTIENPDLNQILETEQETYERLDREWRKI
jgi:1-deoxy-D-xylulose-5-phosphate reductoisomerase